MNDLAVYRHCNYYSVAIDLSPMENFEIQYLNVEDGIIYGIPSVFQIWLKDCQNYLEKVFSCLLISCYIYNKSVYHLMKSNWMLLYVVHFTLQCSSLNSNKLENFLL